MSESKARLLLRIPAALKARLAALADRERRSLNKQIEFLLDQCIREDEKVQGPGLSSHKKSGRGK